MMPEQRSFECDTRQTCRKRRFYATTAALAAMLLVLVTFHAPILRAVVSPLIAPADDRPVDYVLISCSTEDLPPIALMRGLSNVAASSPEIRILLVQPAPSLLAHYGGQPRCDEFVVAHLLAHHFPRDRIETIPAAATTFWDEAAAIPVWLQQRPGTCVGVLAESIGSGNRQAIVRAVGNTSVADRIVVMPVEPIECNSRQWWKSRAGVQAVLLAMIERLQMTFFGRPQATVPTWDPDQYERDLLAGKADR